MASLVPEYFSDEENEGEDSTTLSNRSFSSQSKAETEVEKDQDEQEDQHKENLEILAINNNANEESQGSVRREKEDDKHEQQNDDLLITNSPNTAVPNTLDNLSIENGFLPGCDQIRLPPSPKGQCSLSLQNKINQVMHRMSSHNYSINDDIKAKKSFKNPCIYQKLVEAYGIDEFGSSFSNYIDDLKAHGYRFYDELSEAQLAEWTKKEQERKERKKIEFVKVNLSKR